MRINTKKIQLELDRLEWSVQELANRMGKKRQWVYFVMDGTKSHTFITVQNIADALGVESRDLII